jgi:hypothetical protein
MSYRGIVCPINDLRALLVAWSFKLECMMKTNMEKPNEDENQNPGWNWREIQNSLPLHWYDGHNLIQRQR